MERLAFPVRLAAAVVVTLAALVFAGQHVLMVAVRETLIEEHAVRYAADADGIAAALEEPDERAAMRRARELIREIGSRPSVVNVELIDAKGRVVAATDVSDIGDLEDPPTHALVASGGSYAGPELEGDRHDDEELEYLEPVEAATSRYALEIDEDASLMEEHVAAIQADVLKIGLLSIPVTVVVFFLLGGRGLVRRHHAALHRAEHDSLTRLGNHGRFADRLAAEVKLAERRREPLSLAIVDLKRFKQLNDRLGHRAGDQALRAVGKGLASGRVADEAFRIGGDEFAVLMPNEDLDGARTAMKRRYRVTRSLNGDVNLSIGIAALSSDDPHGVLMWEQADQAAYAAKRQAGTAIVTFDDIADAVTAG